MRKLAQWFATALALSAIAAAQQSEPPAPAPEKVVRITFIPPPMEGTISLGVYDQAGKLVRVLKREASMKDFVTGLNGLITSWDGKNDAGAEVPPGKYGLRGYSVGVLDVEGIAYYGNDWVGDDESPRIKRMLPGGGFSPDGGVTVRVELADGKRGRVKLQPDAPSPAETAKVIFQEDPAEDPDAAAPSDLPQGAIGSVEVHGETFACGKGQVWRRKPGAEWMPADFPGLRHPIYLCAGQNTLWIIDGAPEGAAVKEYSQAGEPLRELAVAEGEPKPVWMDARGRDEIVLLEESAAEQRVRILSKAREAPPGEDSPDVPTSTWRTLASRTIHFSDTFDQASALLGRSNPVKIEEQTKIRLLPNPLFKDVASDVTLSLGFDQNGAFLRSADGLPLVGVTETQNLLWAVMSREKGSKALTIFQSDGAVVEEFRAGRLANMMAFDAGDCDWPPSRPGK